MVVFSGELSITGSALNMQMFTSEFLYVRVDVMDTA